MKAIVDRDACIGCGLCATISPEVFELDDEDIAVVIADTVPEDSEENTKEAVEACPTEAISIEE